MTEPTVTDIVLLMARILESLQIPYYVGGSVASTIYGRPRLTQDVDIVAEMQPEHIQPLIEALGNDYYADSESMLEAVEKRRSFNLIHYHSSYKVDVFIPKDRPFDKEQFQRRVKRNLAAESDDTAYIASPEGTILAKLDWYRMGHEVSENQWNDIQGILKAQKALDLAYMRRWAAEIGVADLLERALVESDSTSST
jgi:hypothetical protein